MSQPQPAQPDQPQYQISALDLFPVYATRAAYQQTTGDQAPPFNPSQPLKGWADPAPTGQPYFVFDSTAASTGYVSTLNITAAQASTLNLPGTYNYPMPVTTPTDAMEWGPNSPIGPVDPTTVCIQADAQKVANEIAFLYPAQPISVQLDQPGIYHIVYGMDPRRQWYIQIGPGSGIAYFMAAAMINQKSATHGVGSPGHWAATPAPTPVTGLPPKPAPTWVYDPPVTTAPANAATLAPPIRALLPNEQIVHLPGSLFSQAGTWVVERTDLPQPQPAETSDQQFADVKAALSAIQTVLGAVSAKLGA
jgi:hypothetical protein